MSLEYSAYGQARAANELRKKGILVSSGGGLSIWLRQGVEIFKNVWRPLRKKLPKRLLSSLKLNWLP
jgi:hypothetical protein